MISFKGARFVKEIILTCVRWYLAYPLSYRQVEELMEERGVSVGLCQRSRPNDEASGVEHSQLGYAATMLPINWAPRCRGMRWRAVRERGWL
jgi:hypothetical protein